MQSVTHSYGWVYSRAVAHSVELGDIAIDIDIWEIYGR